MENKEILILSDKLTDETSVYQLVNNEYIDYFDQNNQKISSFDGFELLLTSQFDVCFITKENFNDLIDLINPNNYQKHQNIYKENFFEYKKDNKIYMIQNVVGNFWYLDLILIRLDFGTFFEMNLREFSRTTEIIRFLSGLILNNIHKQNIDYNLITICSMDRLFDIIKNLKENNL